MSGARGRLLTIIFTMALITPAGAVLAQGDEPSPGAEASTGAGQLGATEEVYRDAFDATPDWLDQGEDESGRTVLEDGHVFMSIVGPDANYSDYVELPSAAGVIRVEAIEGLDGNASTAAGPASGSAAGLPRWFVAGVNGGDEWWLGRRIDGRLQVIDRGSLAASSPSRSAVRVAIECGSAPSEGGDYVLMTVDGLPVAASMPRLDIPVGPYDKAGLLIATDGEQGSATFDDLIVHTGETILG